MGAPAASRTQFRQDIQGLRAVAVVLVIVAHLVAYGPLHGSAVVSHLHGGFVGVDVFFVISGFLITGLLRTELVHTDRMSLTGFYARRARRILPAATLVTAATLAVAAWRAPFDVVHQLRGDAVAAAAFVANWHFAHDGTSYFNTDGTSALQHFWSLAVEEQFYLVWPVVLLLVWRFWPRHVAKVLVGIVLASLAWSYVTTVAAGPSAAQAAYFDSVARAYELGIGALVALVRPVVPSRNARFALGIIGAGAIAYATLVFTEDARFPGLLALVPVLGTAALLVSGVGTPTPVQRMLGLGPVRYVGDISYSLYLWHFPVIILAPYVVSHDVGHRVLSLAEIAVTLALSVLSFHLVEEPFRRGILVKGRLALVLWPVSIALLLACVGSAGAWTKHLEHQREVAGERWLAAHPHATGAAVPRTPDRTQVTAELTAALALARKGEPLPSGQVLAARRTDLWSTTYRCYAEWPQTRSQVCTAGDRAAKRVVAVMGDSHAGMWLTALDLLGKQEHVRIRAFIKLGCSPYDVNQRSKNLDPTTCTEYREWSRAEVEREHPAVIVLAARGRLFVKPAAGQTRDDAWRDGIRSAVTQLRATTHDVRVLGDIPATGFDIGDCLSQRDATAASCFVSRDSIETRSNEVTRGAALVAGARYVPTVGLVCPGATCPMVVDGLITYHDDSHLTASWVRYVSTALGEALGPLGRR